MTPPQPPLDLGAWVIVRKDAIADIRAFIQDSLDADPERRVIGNLMSARDVIDAMIAYAPEPDWAGLREAFVALRDHQQQLDQDGVVVGVSRQALDEVLAAFALLSNLGGKEP